MIKIHGCNIINETDKAVVIESLPFNGKSSWTVERDRNRSINLQDFPQSDHNESVGSYRIDFSIGDEPQYGVFSIWTTWDQLYYSTEPGHYVASEQCRMQGTYGNFTPALKGDEVKNMVLNFRVRIRDKSQVVVVANLEVLDRVTA